MVTIDSNIDSVLFTDTTVRNFSYKIRYNVEIYLDLYRYFIDQNLNQIISYYQSSDTDPDYQSFNFLSRLIEQSRIIDNLINLNKNSFNRVDEWLLLEFLDEIKIKLETIENSDKWLRSSKTKNTWRGSVIQTDYVLEDGQTLESVSADVNGVENSQDDWMRIAIENDITEFDYGQETNEKINITKKIASSPNYFLYSIVDNLVNEKLYGIDFDKKISFEDNDVKTLSHNETVKQTFEILILLKKGDIPEFPTLGLDQRVSVGSNLGSVLFTSIVRQLKETFRTDDSLRDFQVLEISYKNGDLTINSSVNTMYNLTYSSKTKL